MKKNPLLLASLFIPALAFGNDQDVTNSVEARYCQSLPYSVLNLYPSPDGLIGYCTLKDGRTVEIHELYKQEQPAGPSAP